MQKKTKRIIWTVAGLAVFGMFLDDLNQGTPASAEQVPAVTSAPSTVTQTVLSTATVTESGAVPTVQLVMPAKVTVTVTVKS